MITSLSKYSNPIYSTNYNDKYNGIVRISNGTNMGTGILLYDGKSVLTAAHIFANNDILNVTASFDTNNKPLVYNGSVEIYNYYDSTNSNGDLAIISLDEFAPLTYNRYELYRDNDEYNQIFTMVGYGLKGDGNSGVLTSSDTTTKLITQNTFETDMSTLKDSTLTNISWNPLQDSMLVADFDNGEIANDALGFYLDINNTGLGDMEGLIASGDSGGPALIDNKVSGIADYTLTINSPNSPDINDKQDNSFGEIGAWTRVSYYQEWIDKTIRNNYEDAPTTKEEVQTTIIENDFGVHYAYFLLEVLGDRSSVDDIVTWTYNTVDGTATAYEDYIPTSGTLTLYKDEAYIAIPVEIIGDTLAEDDETFYLEVSNTSYTGFTNSDITLIAMRTIIDDDLLLG